MTATTLVQLWSSNMVAPCWKGTSVRSTEGLLALPHNSMKPGRALRTALRIQTPDYAQENENTTINAADCRRGQTSLSRLSAHRWEKQTHEFNLLFRSFHAWETSPNLSKIVLNCVISQFPWWNIWNVVCEAEQVSNKSRRWRCGREKTPNKWREAKNWERNNVLEHLLFGVWGEVPGVSQTETSSFSAERRRERWRWKERRAESREKSCLLTLVSLSVLQLWVSHLCPHAWASVHHSSSHSLSFSSSHLVPFFSGGLFFFLICFESAVNCPTSWCETARIKLKGHFIYTDRLSDGWERLQQTPATRTWISRYGKWYKAKHTREESSREKTLKRLHISWKF